MFLLREGWEALLQVSALAGAGFIVYALWSLRGAYVPRFLEDLPSGDIPLPTLSVIVPARNEQEGVEKTVHSLLAQDYPGIQVIAVNDRSTDLTGDILEAVRRKDPRLETVHLTTLPAAWLGKPHALKSGLDRARGDWVLFTDGDVIFEPGTLRKAVARAMGVGADHFIVFPRLDLRGGGEHAVASAFSLLFAVHQRLGRVANPASTAHIGVGAFNLIRRNALEASGGMEPLRMAVTEDVEIGRRMKAGGFRQSFIYSRGGIRLRWQSGLWGMIEGLTKNAFAASRFRVGWTLVQAGGVVVTNGVAPMAVFSDAGWARGIGIVFWLLLFVLYILHRRVNATPVWTVLLYPLGAMILAYILIRSMVVTLRRGGVVWRETFYPIERLREGQTEPPRTGKR